MEEFSQAFDTLTGIYVNLSNALVEFFLHVTDNLTSLLLLLTISLMTSELYKTVKT